MGRGPPALGLPHPRVRRLVAQGVLLLGRSQVLRDGDPVRTAIHDVAAGELAARQTHAGRPEAEAGAQAVVQELQPGLGAGLRDGEGQVHRNKINPAGSTAPRNGRFPCADGCSRRVSRGLCWRPRSSPAGTMVSYPSGSETVSGYLATPAGAGKHPALVVIHEWWGLNDWVKSKADDFAKQGYVALAVDLYRGKVAQDADTAHQLMRGLPDDRALRDMKGAVAYLRSRPGRGRLEDRFDRLVHGRRLLARPRGGRADAVRGRHLLRPSGDGSGHDRGAEGPAAGQLRRPGSGDSAGERARIRGPGEEGREERGLQDLSRRRPRLCVGHEPQESRGRPGRQRAHRRVPAEGAPGR